MKTFLAVFFGILAAVATIVIIVGLIVFVRSIQHDSAQFRAYDLQAPAMHLRSINTACVTYQSTYERGYPRTLADLGTPPAGADPSPQHAGFIDEILASGKIGHYTFIYTPRLRAGQVTGYQVQASPDQRTDDRKRSFFMDDSGVIRYTDQARPATEKDAPWFDPVSSPQP